MLTFIPTYGILLLIRFFAVITKYTILDEQRREAKEGKSQRQNPRSFTRGAKVIECNMEQMMGHLTNIFAHHRFCLY